SEELKSRMALQQLVDRVSILGDRKDFHVQVRLFSENAISETFADGKEILKLKGRKEMEIAFESFLSYIETVYHFNGQHDITINGNTAQGTCYCLITLIGHENGKKIKTTIGAIYQDDYVKEQNNWLIARRTGNFQWQEKREV
ncbi:nuclear transport factor 2 family protein, partial [Flavobacterium sp. LBUM151]